VSTVLTTPPLVHEGLQGAEDELRKVGLAGLGLKKVQLGKRGERDELPLGLGDTPQQMEGYIALSLWPDDRTLGYLACSSVECDIVPPTAGARATVFSFTLPSATAAAEGGAEGQRGFEIAFDGGVLGGLMAGTDSTAIQLTPLASPRTLADSESVQSHLFSYHSPSRTFTPYWKGEDGERELALAAPVSPSSSSAVAQGAGARVNASTGAGAGDGLRLTTDVEGLRERRFSKVSHGKKEGPLTMHFVQVTHEAW